AADGRQRAVLRDPVRGGRRQGCSAGRLGHNQVLVATERETERRGTGRCVGRRRTGRVVLAEDEDVEGARRLLGDNERTARRRELDLRGAATRERLDRARDRGEIPVL